LKILRHLAGIILATLGVLLVLGAVIHLVEPDPEIESWVVAVSFVVGLLPLTGAFFLLRGTVGAPGRSCPQCGGTAKKAVMVLGGKRHRWLFHLSGWFLASLWGASREQEVQCVQCRKVFLTHTRASRIAGVVLWVFVLILGLGVVVEQLQSK
jgi:hypothetical protein